MNDDGFSVLGAPFINVGATGENVGAHVTDFVPTGYLNHEAYQYAGTDGDFTMAIIDNNGIGIHTYTWTHDWDWDDGEKWMPEGHWYDAQNRQFVEKGGALDIVIPAGTGLFMSAPTMDDGDIGSTFQFPHSGEVYQQNVPFVINDDGFSCIANPFPAPVKVSTLTPAGYLNHEAYQYAGTDGDFTMAIIDNNGIGVHTYTWTHDWDWDDGEKWMPEGHWYDAQNRQFVEKDSALDFPIPGGQGLFLSAPTMDDGDLGSQFSYTFICPIK